jgi:hypothetical protein
MRLNQSADGRVRKTLSPMRGSSRWVAFGEYQQAKNLPSVLAVAATWLGGLQATLAISRWAAWSFVALAASPTSSSAASRRSSEHAFKIDHPNRSGAAQSNDFVDRLPLGTPPPGLQQALARHRAAHGTDHGDIRRDSVLRSSNRSPSGKRRMGQRHNIDVKPLRWPPPSTISS